MILKKIHFVSLQKCYSFVTLESEPSYQIFTRLTSQLPNVNRYFIGPFFTSTDEATSMAYEGFHLVSGKSLVGVDLESGPFNSGFGTENILKNLVPHGLLEELDQYYLWSQVSPLIKDQADYLVKAKKAIEDLFKKLADGDECLVFTVFPFGEIICEEYFGTAEDIPIFSFLQGFSLVSDGQNPKVALLG